MKVTHVVCTDSFAGVERHVATLAAAQDIAGKVTQALGGLGVFGVGVRVGLGARRRTGERRTGRLADASAGSSGTSGSGG